MHSRYRLFLLTLALLTLAARTTFPVMAQTPTGSIRGVVKDQQGAVILNASVTVTNTATGAARSTNTGSDGIYAVENLPAGDYEVKIEAQGFATQNTSVIVRVGSTTSGDASLRAGSKGEVIDVVAEAPIIELETADTQFAAMYLGFASSELDQNQITDYLTRVVAGRFDLTGYAHLNETVGRFAPGFPRHSLANTEVPALRSMLDAAGPRFQMHEPATWPQQAHLLATGAWQEFKELTDRLDGGRAAD